MPTPNVAGATQYALDRLARELDPRLVYHSLAHTRDDVLPASERLAALEGIDDADLLLLRTAASFHDLGFVEVRRGHEEVGARIAAAVLPGYGYTPAQIECIHGMIMATRLPQSPRTPLECILADADLDLLGREEFLTKNALLRQELASYGAWQSDLDWYTGQVAFVRAHRYWTHAARTLRDAQKARNLAALHALRDAAST